jgi:glycosyltransferase involved in cell wall biosynthesis
MQRICTSLANAGYDVLLVGRKLKNSVPLTEEVYSQRRLHPFFTKGKLFYIEYNIRLFFFLFAQQFDIICGIDLDTVLPAWLIAHWKKKKVVYDAHELFPEVPEVIDRRFTKKVWNWVEKFAIKRITNCYTVSEGLADYFESKYGRKFEVIRNFPLAENGSKNELNAVPHEKEQSFILYQGALNEGRGLEQLILAMHQIPMKLILAGEGDLSGKLRQLVNDSNLNR